MENFLFVIGVVMVLSIILLLVICIMHCGIRIMTRPKIVDKRKNEESDKIILFS